MANFADLENEIQDKHDLLDQIDKEQLYEDFELKTLRTKVNAHKNFEGQFPHDLDELELMLCPEEYAKRQSSLN